MLIHVRMLEGRCAVGCRGEGHTRCPMAHETSNGTRNIEWHTDYRMAYGMSNILPQQHTSVGAHIYQHTPLSAHTSAGSHPCQPDPPRTWLHLHSDPAPNYSVIADTRAHRHDSCRYGYCYWVLAETQCLAPPVCCHIGSRNHGEDGVNSAPRTGLAPLLKRAPPL